MVRKSTVFISCIAVLIMGGLLLMFIHPRTAAGPYREGLAAGKQLVRELELTDLCLFTEARYTRHISQADLHSAFQDHPMALEHFPSGAMMSPPVRFKSLEIMETER